MKCEELRDFLEKTEDLLDCSRGERLAVFFHMKDCQKCVSWLEDRVREEEELTGKLTVEEAEELDRRGIPVISDDLKDPEFRMRKLGTF